jgi:hypothetical protein
VGLPAFDEAEPSLLYKPRGPHQQIGGRKTDDKRDEQRKKRRYAAPQVGKVLEKQYNEGYYSDRDDCVNGYGLIF